MSTVVEKEAFTDSGAHCQKSWVGRHKVLSGAIIVVLAVVIGGTIVAWPILKLRFHSQYITALNEIRKDPTVIEKLGEPIETVRIFPGGRVESTGNGEQASFFFDVAGPKGSASVNVISRMVDGTWGFTKVELTFEDQKRIDLAQKLQQAAGDDTPRFDPNAAQQAVKQPDLPSNIEINIPNLPGEPKK
jgi:Cytochrome oxidase complex assembly protein 1